MLIYFLQYELISLFRQPKKAKAKSLLSSSRLYAEGEKVDGSFSEEIRGKIFMQIEKICKTSCWCKHLHCLGKRAQSQEASRQDQNSLIKNISVSGKDWESTVNNIWVVRKGCTNLCAPTLVNLINTNQSRFIFQTQRKHWVMGDTLWPNFQKILNVQYNRLH